MNVQPAIRLFLIALASLPLSAIEQDPLDRVEISGGAILVGRIEETTAEVVRLKTSYAGTLEIDRSQVVKVTTSSQEAEKLTSLIAKSTPKGSLSTDGVAPNVPEPAKGWLYKIGFNLTGNNGNTDKLDVALSGDINLDREVDRVDLYGRYAYGTNRDVRSANEIILGGRYTNFFFDGIGIFFRNELEHDDFEGILYRSTTASGLSWKISEEKDLKLEARSGLSYRYEDYEDDGHQDFPGMDLGFDIDWRFAKWARFNGSYTILPSVSNVEDYILRQDTGVNVPLDFSNLWELRLGITSKYNNQPEMGRERLDHKYYARLVASWH
jgi:hypothetical protein